MAYQKQTFIDYPNDGYTVLKAEHLNHIEDGIGRVSALFPEVSSGDFGKQLFVNEAGDGFLLIGNTTTYKWENLVEQAELYRPGYIAGKGATQSDGSVLYQAASSFQSAINMPVKGGTKYYIGGPSSTSGFYARFVNWQSDKYTGLSNLGAITSMSDQEIAAVTISMTGAISSELVTAPDDAKYCTVVFYDLSQGGTENNYMTTIANPADRVDKVVNNSLEMVSSGKWNMIEDVEVKNNYWFCAMKNNGNYQGGGFYTCYNIPVKGGNKYYLGPDFNGQYARFLNWSSDKYVLDANGMLAMTDEEVAKIALGTSQATRAEEHSAPAGAKYCSVTFYVGYGEITPDQCYFTSIAEPAERKDAEPVYNVISQGVSQAVLDQIDKNTEDLQLLSGANQKLTNLEEYNFIQKTRRPVINFQFDDAILAGDTICKQIFDDYGYKCDFAITSPISGEKLTAYIDFQNQGFGILSHSTDGAGMGSVADEADRQLKINKMKTSYLTLKNKGFDIHGWVTPSSGLHNSLYEPLAAIYDYGFGTGQSSSVYHKFGEEKHIAHMSRVGIESNLILKTAESARNSVMNYIETIWGAGAPDANYERVEIVGVPFSSLVANAIMDGYNEVVAENGVINEAGLSYLKEIWGVSTEDATLAIDTTWSLLTLTPTFKICCEREGMKNIRNYVDTAIAQTAFLSFYAHNTYSEDNTENGYGINLSKYIREILAYCQRVGAVVLTAKDAMRDYFSFRYTDFLELKGG